MWNSVTVDGCASTNDTVLLFANGASGIQPDPPALTVAVEAVCRDLARQVVADAEGPLRALEGSLAHLDGLRARARWAREFGGAALAPGGERLRLKRARHPLLVMAERQGGRAVVPLDLEQSYEQACSDLWIV